MLLLILLLPKVTPWHVMVGHFDTSAPASSACFLLNLHHLLHLPSNAWVVAQGLLQLGSGVNARDKGGATPLFVACESGHATCAKLLLAAGANVLLRNSAGEAPLYIAALRGEILVVDVLLHHMHEQGICWQVPARSSLPPPITSPHTQYSPLIPSGSSLLL